MTPGALKKEWEHYYCKAGKISQDGQHVGWSRVSVQVCLSRVGQFCVLATVTTLKLAE